MFQFNYLVTIGLLKPFSLEFPLSCKEMKHLGRLKRACFFSHATECQRQKKTEDVDAQALG